MATMPRDKPFSVPDPLGEAWDDAARRNRILQAKNDPLAAATKSSVVAIRPGSTAASSASSVAGPAPGLGEDRRGVGPLLALISRAEGTSGPEGYDVVFGYDRYKPAASGRLTHMTLDEVAQLQADMLKRGSGSTAVGKYQFLQGTLNELKGKLGLEGSERFSPQLQDELALARLYGTRNLDRFLSGEITAQDFQKQLANEWSSLPTDAQDYSRPWGRKGQRTKARVTTADDVLPALEATLRGSSVLDAQIDGGYLPPP